jgi:hypothetical protein
VSIAISEDDEPTSSLGAIQPGSMSRAVVPPPPDRVAPVMNRLADVNRARLASSGIVDDVVGSFMV